MNKHIVAILSISTLLSHMSYASSEEEPELDAGILRIRIATLEKQSDEHIRHLRSELADVRKKSTEDRQAHELLILSLKEQNLYLNQKLIEADGTIQELLLRIAQLQGTKNTHTDPNLGRSPE